MTNNGSPVNYTYDAAGNVTNDGVHNYTYDAENRVVSVDGGATAQYRYDHQNRRLCKIIGSSWTHYIWEGGHVIAEHDATTGLPGFGEPPYQQQSARLDYVYSGARMIRSRQRTSSTGPWTSRYFLSDRLSLRVTLDTSGNVLGRQAHLPFGEDFAESGTQEKCHFTSYERDSETSTDYAVNRGYSPGVGRFSRADPYRPSGGVKIPQSCNRYSYVHNDPVNAMDPLGLLICFRYHWDSSQGNGWSDISCLADEPGGGSGSSVDTGSGSGTRLPPRLVNKKAKKMLREFLEKNPGCTGVIDQKAQQAGVGLNLSNVWNSTMS